METMPHKTKNSSPSASSPDDFIKNKNMWRQLQLPCAVHIFRINLREPQWQNVSRNLTSYRHPPSPGLSIVSNIKGRGKCPQRPINEIFRNVKCINRKTFQSSDIHSLNCTEFSSCSVSRSGTICPSNKFVEEDCVMLKSPVTLILKPCKVIIEKLPSVILRRSLALAKRSDANRTRDAESNNGNLSQKKSFNTNECKPMSSASDGLRKKQKLLSMKERCDLRSKNLNNVCTKNVKNFFKGKKYAVKKKSDTNNVHRAKEDTENAFSTTHFSDTNSLPNTLKDFRKSDVFGVVTSEEEHCKNQIQNISLEKSEELINLPYCDMTPVASQNSSNSHNFALSNTMDKENCTKSCELLSLLKGSNSSVNCSEFSCVQCSYKFSCSSELYKHVCCGKRRKGFLCVFCEKIFRHTFSLKRHVKVIHNIT